MTLCISIRKETIMQTAIAVFMMASIVFCVVAIPTVFTILVTDLHDLEKTSKVIKEAASKIRSDV